MAAPILIVSPKQKKIEERFNFQVFTVEHQNRFSLNVQ